MKVISTLFLLLTLSLTSIAQLKEQNSELYLSKIESYTKMKKTGGTLSIIGGGLTVVSIVLIANADWDKKSLDAYGNEVYDVPGDGMLGILGVSVGIPVCVTGIVLNSIAKRKLRFYNEKLKNIDVGMFQHGQQTGLTLKYRF